MSLLSMQKSRCGVLCQGFETHTTTLVQWRQQQQLLWILDWIFQCPFTSILYLKKKKTRFTFPKAVETFFEHLTDWVVF